MSGEPGYFDSHLHLTDARFGGDLPGVLADAREAGVREMVTVGTSPGDARRALELARAEEGMWCTAGLHPHDASHFSRRLVDELEEVLSTPEAVAVGETGLDYHYDNSPRAAQRESFRAHLELAARLSLPVVVHSRDADVDTAGFVRAFGDGVTGVLHCFTGGDALLEAALQADWYVSFSGIATFGNFGGEHRVRRVPADRLLVETDSPYLAPVPVRGRRNEPAYLVHTLRAVAEMRDEPVAAAAAATRENARRFYRLG